MKQRKFRMEEDLYQSIPGSNKSAWVREAISQRLQGEKGLTSDYTNEIKEIRSELRAIGTNINQLAKKANQGLPVALSEIEKNKLLDQIILADKHTLKILRLLNV